MISSEYYIEGASWQVDAYDLTAVRTVVFIDEQGFSEEEEFDELDHKAIHFLARDNQGQAIGTARLLSDGCIGRIAVLTDWRGKQVGSALLRTAIESAKTRGLSEIRLAAQTQAIRFYQRFGFSQYGGEFDEAGIPHYWMRLELVRPDAASEPRRREVRRDSDSDTTSFGNADQYREQLLRLINRSRQQLSFFLGDLESRVLDHADTLNAIKQLAITGHDVQIRFVVIDSAKAIQSGHRLIQLCQRLTSAIQVRNPSPKHKDIFNAFVLGEGGDLIYREFNDRWDGEYQQGNRLRHQQLLQRFTEIWEYGIPDPNIRRIDL